MEQIEYFKLFQDICIEDYHLLTSNLKIKTFNKGDFITTVGQTQRELYFVKSGVQMSYFNTGSKTHVMSFTYEHCPCLIPESFLFQTPSKYFLTCLSDSEMECISYVGLQKLFDQSQPIERLLRRMTEVAWTGMINRHIELHSMTIEERFKSFCQRSPHLLQFVPHKYIASYLGIDPTNFSKLFNTVKF